MAKRKKTALKRRIGSAGHVHAPRDGATNEQARRHDVVSRAAGIGGQRVRSQLERMAMQNIIRPEECHAGWRFARDYLVGVEPPGRSSISFAIRGGDGHMSEMRLDATQAHRLARDAIERQSKNQRDPHPTVTMIAFCVNDTPMAEIARSMAGGGSVLPRTAKRRVCHDLSILAEHYKRLDETAGRSTTLYDLAAVLKLFDPVDKRNQVVD